MARMTPAEDTLTALIHLLDQEGYDAVTVDQLAREAGMSRASFFRHVGGKEEVVFADHAALLERLDVFLRGTVVDLCAADVAEGEFDWRIRALLQ